MRRVGAGTTSSDDGRGRQALPIAMMPGFKNRILPVLIVYLVVTAAFTLLGQPIALVIGSWATITTIMFWPVGKAVGRKYTSYRTGWFILGVGSMVGIPVFGYLIISSADPVVKTISLIGLALDIGVWGIPASTRSAFSPPLPMLFRPDLIFGDGRLLAGGIVAVGLGVKFIFSNMPPGNVPVGNWYALFFVIILALVQMIPLRGVWKMRDRISRLLFDRRDSYSVAVAKESYLLIAIAALMFSFHNFFGGVVPFTRNVLAGSNDGMAITLISAIFIIFARSWYKKYRIGDPFIVESLGQSLVKHAIFAVGLVGLVYGFLNVMLGGFPRTPNVGGDLYLTTIGLGMLVWGIILLIPIRAWAQVNQRRAMMRQMVEVLLPRLNDEQRAKTMGKVIEAVSELSEERRLKIVGDMASFIGELGAEDKEKVMKTQLQVISSLQPEKRIAIMKAMDLAITHR